MCAALFIAVILLIYSFNSVRAQKTSFSISDLPGYIMLREWSSDSTIFVFQNPQVGTDTWFSVDVNTAQLMESAEYPVSPNLSEAESQVFQTQDVIRPSPDGELLLYSTNSLEYIGLIEGESRNFWYTLANRNTREIMVTRLGAANEVHLGELVNLEWSANSNGLAIGDLTPAGTRSIYYISVPDHSDLQTAEDFTFDMEIDGQRIYTADPFTNRLLDVNSSGELVLLTAQIDDPNLDVYSEPTVFVLWNPFVPEASQLIQIPNIASALSIAAFSPESEDSIFVWEFDAFGSVSGTLYLYNLRSGNLRILRTISPLYSPLFSPDGEWLSYSSETELVFLKI
jgi:Tol biopolymer transport system component